jgi:hypothetical protein
MDRFAPATALRLPEECVELEAAVLWSRGNAGGEKQPVLDRKNNAPCSFADGLGPRANDLRFSANDVGSREDDLCSRADDL